MQPCYNLAMSNEQITDAAEYSTGIYADIQNLQEMAQDVLKSLIYRWPKDMPKPTKLNLYVRADHTHLWNVWATSAFRDMQVTVKGVQHYSLSATKNAADMAIAVDAISDFNHKRVSHVAVVSDDSDFISLYAKLAEEMVASEDNEQGRRAPFLWVFTDRHDTRSNLLQEFFPRRYVHVVDRYAPFPDEDDYYDDEDDDFYAEAEQPSEPEAAVEEETPETGEPETPKVEEEPPRPRPPRPQPIQTRDMPVNERIAVQLIRDMPVGRFKSTDCQDIIRSNFEDHALAKADGPAFGIAFRRDLLPFMEKRGVIELPNQRPRLYEMTIEAKNSLVAK